MTIPSSFYCSSGVTWASTPSPQATTTNPSMSLYLSGTWPHPGIQTWCGSTMLLKLFGLYSRWLHLRAGLMWCTRQWMLWKRRISHCWITTALLPFTSLSSWCLALSSCSTWLLVSPLTRCVQECRKNALFRSTHTVARISVCTVC